MHERSAGVRDGGGGGRWGCREGVMQVQKVGRTVGGGKKRNKTEEMGNAGSTNGEQWGGNGSR